MQKKNFCLSALAASAVLIGSHAASADVLALYDFSEFTSEQADAYLNVTALSPYQNHASSSLGTVTGLTNSGIASLVANTTRDTTAQPVGPVALLMGANGVATAAAPVPSTSYLGFTVTAADTLFLQNLSFDLGTSVGANTNAPASGDWTHWTLETYGQLFYSTDGGTTFNPIGDSFESIADNISNEGAFTGMNAYSIDLSSLSLSGGQSVEFRLAFADNRGSGTTAMGHYLDNITLEGVIPEPTSIGLLGLAGAGLLVRRRRA